MNTRSILSAKSQNKRRVYFGDVMPQVFDHKNFYAHRDQDLKQARFLVKIQSPFITNRRVDKLAPVLKDSIKRKVKVCVFTQTIESRYSTKEEYLEKVSNFKIVSDSLSSIGVHVNTIPKIHEKLVVIDECVFGEGSLNPLSYRDTTERMTRWQGVEKVRSVVTSHRLDNCYACRKESLDDELENVFGNIMAKRRKMLNLSQLEFSQLTGLSQSTISRLEKGKYNCRLHTISKILSVLYLHCRPLLWHMLPSFDYELNKSLKLNEFFDQG